VALELERLEAGGFEDDLRRIVDEVEESRETELSKALGRLNRAYIMAEIKQEVLDRFGQVHPGTKVKFLTGPYRDSNEGIGPARRMR
jgi:hypothetical protein